MVAELYDVDDGKSSVELLRGEGTLLASKLQIALLLCCQGPSN